MVTLAWCGFSLYVMVFVASLCSMHFPHIRFSESVMGQLTSCSLRWRLHRQPQGRWTQRATTTTKMTAPATDVMYQFVSECSFGEYATAVEKWAKWFYNPLIDSKVSKKVPPLLKRHSSFQLSVESNQRLHWFCVASFCVWYGKLAPLFHATNRMQPIACKTNPKQLLVTHIFPRFWRLVCFLFQVFIGSLEYFLPLDWSFNFFGFAFTQLSR